MARYTFHLQFNLFTGGKTEMSRKTVHGGTRDKAVIKVWKHVQKTIDDTAQIESFCFDELSTIVLLNYAKKNNATFIK